MRNAGGKNIVEGRNAIGGNEQQTLLIEKVHVANFAAGVELQFREVGL